MVGVPKRPKEETHFIVELYFQRRTIKEIYDACVQKWPQRRTFFTEAKLKYICNHYGKHPEFIPLDAEGNQMPPPPKRQSRTPNRRPTEPSPPSNPRLGPLESTPKRANQPRRKAKQMPGNPAYALGGSLHESPQLASSLVSPGPNGIHMSNGRLNSMPIDRIYRHPLGYQPPNPFRRISKSPSNGQASSSSSPSGYQQQNPLLYGKKSSVLSSLPLAAHSNRVTYSGFNSSAGQEENGNSGNSVLGAPRSSGMQAQTDSLGYRQHGQLVQPQPRGITHENTAPGHEHCYIQSQDGLQDNFNQVHRNNVHQAQPQGGAQDDLNLITLRKNVHGIYVAYDAQGYEIPMTVAQRLTRTSYRNHAQSSTNLRSSLISSRRFANGNGDGSPSPHHRQRVQAGNSSRGSPPVIGSHYTQRSNSANSPTDIEELKIRNPDIDPQLLTLQNTGNTQDRLNNQSNTPSSIPIGPSTTNMYPIVPAVPDVCHYNSNPLRQQMTSTNSEPSLHSHSNHPPSHTITSSAALGSNTTTTMGAAPGMVCSDGREGTTLATAQDTPERFGRNLRAPGIMTGGSRGLSASIQEGKESQSREVVSASSMKVSEKSESRARLQPCLLPYTFERNDNTSELANLNPAPSAGNLKRTSLLTISQFSPQDPITQASELLLNKPFEERVRKGKMADTRADPVTQEAPNVEIPSSGTTLQEDSSNYAAQAQSTEQSSSVVAQTTESVVTTRLSPQLLDSHKRKAHNRAMEQSIESSPAEEPTPKRVSLSKAEEVPKSRSPLKRSPIYYNMPPRGTTMPLTLPTTPLLEVPLLTQSTEAEKVDHQDNTVAVSNAPAEASNNEQTQFNNIMPVSATVNGSFYDVNFDLDNGWSQEDEDVIREFFETGEYPLGYPPPAPNAQQLETQRHMSAFMSPEEEGEANYREALAYVEEKTGISQADYLAGDPALAGNPNAQAIGQQMASYNAWLAKDHGPHYSTVWNQEWFDSLDAGVRRRFIEQFPYLADNSYSTATASSTGTTQASSVAPTNQFLAQYPIQAATSSSAATASDVWTPTSDTWTPEQIKKARELMCVAPPSTGEGSSLPPTATTSTSYTEIPQAGSFAPTTESDDDFSEFIDYTGGADWANAPPFECDPVPNPSQDFTDAGLQAATPAIDDRLSPNEPEDESHNEAKENDGESEDLLKGPRSPKH